MSRTHKILMITTGGTIAGHVAVDKLDNYSVRTGREISLLVAPTVNYLNSKNRIDIEIDTLALCDVDSSNILPQQWAELAKLIKTKYDEYESFLIIHGTNTLGYTCAALSFALANPNKPIILTGSQVSAGLPGSDALTNIENSIRVAVLNR